MSDRAPARRRIWKFGLLALPILMLAGRLCSRIPTAHFALSETRHCELEFDQWDQSRGLLAYHENDRLIGTASLPADFFNNPIAFFPGPDGHTVICLTYLDTSYAAFTVDLAKPNQDEQFHRLRLHVPAEPIVDRSDFAVRACTAREVEHVTRYIKDADAATLQTLVRGGGTAETKKNLLTVLAWSTNPPTADDPVLQYAKPQLLPEN